MSINLEIVFKIGSFEWKRKEWYKVKLNRNNENNNNKTSGRIACHRSLC